MSIRLDPAVEAVRAERRGCAMSGHTPGPWHRNIPPASKYPAVWSGRNTHVAHIVAGAPRRSGSGETMSEQEQEANINLIASAPDLLEALEAQVASTVMLARSAGYSDADIACMTSQARRAIRLAESGTRTPPDGSSLAGGA